MLIHTQVGEQLPLPEGYSSQAEPLEKIKYPNIIFMIAQYYN